MNYSQAVQFLYNLRRFGMQPGLEKSFQLAAAAGNPQERLRFIHVAGTNGKGSTCAMLESIYRAAGYRTGLFTSPHLVSFRERIQVNRQLISEAAVARLAGEFGGETSCTLFEAVTIMALKYFLAQRCDVVIWETGLGGRLDSTNIVTPLASVITNVQLDHQQWLGETIPAIAREKAGIIKPGIPVITTATGDALEVIERTATERRARLVAITAAREYKTGLAGAHQQLNAALAATTVTELRGVLPVDEAAITKGLKEARWDGRQQKIEREDGRIVLLDGAHNPAGAQTLAETLATEYRGLNPALILGAMADKDCAGICALLAPTAEKIVLTRVGSERSADPSRLAELCRAANPSASIAIIGGLEEAIASVEREKFVVITGSLHFIGEAIERLGLAETASERELNEYAGAARKGEIRAVTFDVGGTLIQPWPSVGHVYAAVAARHGLAISAEVLNQNFAAAWKRKKDFGHSIADWSNLVNETFAGLMPAAPSEELFAELYDEFKQAKAWRIFDDALPTLQELRQRGFKLAAISNWDERLRPLLRELDLDRYFDAIIISAEVKCPKPGTEIFKTAAEKLGVAPNAILHVGDSRAEDYDGAVAADFKALVIRRDKPLDGVNEIKRLDEVLSRV